MARKRVTVDCYTHFACDAFVQYLEAQVGHPMVFRGLFSRIPELTDVAARLRFMDELDVDVSCLVPLPWLECEPALHADVELATQACRIANDEMAKLVAAHPDRFVGVALVPTVSAQAMVDETRRAVLELGLAGVALFCGPTVKPLDDPSFELLYSTCQELDVAVWIHPCRPQNYADYDQYQREGKGSLHQIWNSFGWIYDTSVAMVHIALGGVFRRYPHLKLISHHHGGMVPFFTERFITQRRNFQEEGDEDMLSDLKYFYCDTATFGVNSANIEQSLDFFLPGRVMFGTDTPMDMGNRGGFLASARKTIDGLRCLSADEAERERQLHNLYAGNVLAMLGKRAPPSLQTAPSLASL
ncbi:hypothetical protein JKP88DRAFT_311755 [Tribonema minus]|uniref:Amidohydrolase-related domain-containing protein n=1 Tax=Tribonema minus TaxID=303371 RepID=A0A835Z1K2_9STRA|nr:hypothetical protein JKP88DRAFT_311755 [Tribonema minus]